MTLPFNPVKSQNGCHYPQANSFYGIFLTIFNQPYSSEDPICPPTSTIDGYWWRAMAPPGWGGHVPPRVPTKNENSLNPFMQMLSPKYSRNDKKKSNTSKKMVRFH